MYQVAPTIPGAFYELNQVAVLKGTVAFAVGGNPFGTDGTPSLNTNVVASSGTIIATTNGGFSWVTQTLAGFTYTCPTAYTTSTAATYANTITAATVSGTGQITQKPAAAGSNIYSWCATTTAYAPAATQAANTIPYISGVAFTQTAGVYKGWAVGNRGAVYTTTFTPSAVSPFLTATSWVFYNAPAAFVNAVQLSSGWVNLYGIVWDNSNVGYIYGVNLILSTHNAGINWMVETPNSMIVGTTPTNIWGIATGAPAPRLPAAAHAGWLLLLNAFFCPCLTPPPPVHLARSPDHVLSGGPYSVVRTAAAYCDMTNNRLGTPFTTAL